MLVLLPSTGVLAFLPFLLGAQLGEKSQPVLLGRKCSLHRGETSGHPVELQGCPTTLVWLISWSWASLNFATSSITRSLWPRGGSLGAPSSRVLGVTTQDCIWTLSGALVWGPWSSAWTGLCPFVQRGRALCPPCALEGGAPTHGLFPSGSDAPQCPDLQRAPYFCLIKHQHSVHALHRWKQYKCPLAMNG